MKTEIYNCDIKGCENYVPQKNRGLEILTVFVTEQTEGCPSKPYLSKERLDLCEVCFQRYIDSFCLIGAGAQGVNDFRFRVIGREDQNSQLGKEGEK